MTVSSSVRSAGPFVGNGVASSFPFTFKVFAAADLQLYYTDPAGTQTPIYTNFSVTLNPDQDNNPGGTITYPLVGSLMSSSESLSVLGDLEYQQGTDITNAGRFLPNVIENAFDYITMLIQQVLERTARAFTYPVGETVGGSLPSVANRAGRYLAFDDAGNPIAANAVSGAVSRSLESVTATAGQTLFTLSNPYVPGTSSLDIFVNGLRLSFDEYVETSSASVTINTALEAGDEVQFLINAPLTFGFSTEGASYVPAGTAPTTTNVQARLRAAWKSPEENGAIGDGVTDDTAAIQRCIDYLEDNDIELATLTLGAKPYYILGTLTITKPIRIVGQGVRDLDNARPTTRPTDGTWLIHANPTGPLFSVSIETAKGAALENFGVFQTGHATPGVGWVPTVHDWVIRNENSQGSLKLRRVHFHNVYLGVLNNHAARPQFEDITGQFFLNAFTFDQVFDIGKLDGLHCWTFWSEDTSVLQWTQAYGKGVVLGRVDGLWMDRIFTFALAIAVYCGPSGFTTGGARVINIGGIYADFTGRALVVDNSVTHVFVDKLFHLGQAWPVSPVASLPSSTGVHIASGTNSLVQISNFYSVLAGVAAATVDGANNQLWISSFIAEQFDKSAGGHGAVSAAATNFVYVANVGSQSNAAAVTGPRITGPGTLKSPVTQQFQAGTGTNKLIAAAAAAGQLAVLIPEGETNAGVSIQGVGTGIAQLGAAANRISFYGGASAAKAALTGAKGGNVALANLITYLADRGFLTDSTT